tara:strand:+ start:39 stop:212 length:174 start_codon:yes stop_codon:yes gene_type:complete
MGKGSKRRPTLISDEQFKDNWDNIFARKKIPTHGATKIHKDKTKLKPRDYKYKNIEE